MYQAHGLEELLQHHIQHYNPKRYWKYREIVIAPSSKWPKLIRLLMLLYIKRCDAFNNASLGTYIGAGSKFLSPPRFAHGLNGIVIAGDAIIGRNADIFQQVTIMSGGTIIGDNVMIGAGAKILGGVKIGNNVKIGANAVVISDVPDNATVVMQKPRIILHENKKI